MKTLHPILAVLALGVLAACQVPNAGTGSLKISLPSSSKAILTQTDVVSKGDKVRLQLVRNGITVPLSGNAFLEENLSGQTVALDGLPTGTNYQLYAATGKKTTDGTFFQVAYYQVSDPFEISSGVETAVGLKLSRTPVHLLASGPHSNASVAMAGVLHQTDSTGYRTWNSLTTSSNVLTSSSLWSGKSLHSLNQASGSGVFLNTSGGLFTGNGTSASALTMTASDGTTTLTPDITKSGSFTSTGVTSNTLDVYAGPGLTAGLRISGGAHNYWYDLNSLLKVDTLPASVKDSLAKSDGLIRDFTVVAGRFAYIATALGTYRVDSGMLDNKNPTQLGQSFIDRDPGVVLTASLDGRTQFIQSVSAYGTGSAGIAFAGTSRGLFSGLTGNTGIPVVGLGLVGGTFGLDIATLTTTSFFSTVYTAAYSENTHEVLILTGTGNLVARYPVLAGFPTGKLTLSWWPVGLGYLKLAVSGDNGTVYLDVAYVPLS